MLTLPDLIEQARLASERMSVNNPNRVLLKEMAVAIVSLAKMNAELQQQAEDKPRIIVP
jgi:hypothetical protein